jgi:hypothetical protein
MKKGKQIDLLNKPRRTVVRFTRLHQTGFEAVGMDLKDHANPRRLLVSLSGNDRRYARPQITDGITKSASRRAE